MNLDSNVNILAESGELLPCGVLLFGKSEYYNFDVSSSKDSISFGYGRLFIEYEKPTKLSFSHLDKKIWDGAISTNYTDAPLQESDFLGCGYERALDNLVHSFIKKETSFLALEFNSENGLCSFCKEKDDFYHEFSPALYSFLDFYGRLLVSNQNFSQFEDFQDILFSLNNRIPNKNSPSKIVKNFGKIRNISEEFYRRILSRQTKQ